MNGLFAIVVIIINFTPLAYGADLERAKTSEMHSGYLDETCQAYEPVIFCGSSEHFETFKSWMDLIVLTEIGRETVQAIAQSKNQLMIRHNKNAVHSAGRALAPMTSKLTNGVGDDVRIEMNFDIPLEGSHIVPSYHEEDGHSMTPFTADQNLMHELSHGRHKMNGTWHMLDSEGQAINDENLYRQQSSSIENPPLRNAKRYGQGVQIWHLAA